MRELPDSEADPIEVEAFAPLITEREAAELLGVSFRTLQAWRVRGRGPPFCKIGRAVRYTRPLLLEYVEAQVRSSTSQSRAA